MSVVVQEKINLADSRQNLVNFYAEYVTEGEVCLDPIPHHLWLPIELGVNAMPRLKEDLQ